MKIKLNSGPVLFTIGPILLDQQDLFILFGLVITTLIANIILGSIALIFGFIISGIILRNVLIAKGHWVRKNQ